MYLRAIQKYVEDPLAEQIINSEIEEGDTIIISLKGEGDDQEILVSVKKNTTKAKEEAKEEANDDSSESDSEAEA